MTFKFGFGFEILTGQQWACPWEPMHVDAWHRRIACFFLLREPMGRGNKSRDDTFGFGGLWPVAIPTA